MRLELPTQRLSYLLLSFFFDPLVAEFVIMFLELGTFTKLLWDSVVYSQVFVYFAFVLFEGLDFQKKIKIKLS